MEPNRQHIEQAYRAIQQHICEVIAGADGGAQFGEDPWTRPEGGGGITRILQQGRVLEKAGVNFSAVEGVLSPAMEAAIKAEGTQFFATGVSVVMHPHNPHVPIIHMNIRYFETDSGQYWFGGGIDLTPHYVVPAQAAWFHRQLKALCDAHDPTYYPRFKTWADDYFYIAHRNETRGIGGIFYDHLAADATHTKSDIFDFSKSVGMLFPQVYSHLMGINAQAAYTPVQKEWQLLRRGRYVEFNLVYDRGTRFGLQSNGRSESILMSLPLEARWYYNHVPAHGTPEAETLQWLRKGVDFAGMAFH